MNDNDSVVLYRELIANFGAAYAATQESVKSQGTTIASLHGQMQVQVMQQNCTALGQQPPPGIYRLQKQQCCHHGASRRPSTGGRQNLAPTLYQQPRGFPGGQCLLQPPTPFKTFENWNYCQMHGGDIDNSHTGMSCCNPGPLHNLNATRTNTTGGNMAGQHRTILPSTSSCIPPAPRQPQAPTPMVWQQPLSPVNFTQMMAVMHPMMPATPYQGINYMGHQLGPPSPQFRTPPPAVAPPAPPPAPPAGMMMPYYNLHTHPPNF